MDTVKELLDTARDLAEIVYLILMVRKLFKNKDDDN